MCPIILPVEGDSKIHHFMWCILEKLLLVFGEMQGLHSIRRLRRLQSFCCCIDDDFFAIDSLYVVRRWSCRCLSYDRR